MLVTDWGDFGHVNDPAHGRARHDIRCAICVELPEILPKMICLSVFRASNMAIAAHDLLHCFVTLPRVYHWRALEYLELDDGTETAIPMLRKPFPAWPIAWLIIYLTVETQ